MGREWYVAHGLVGRRTSHYAVESDDIDDYAIAQRGLPVVVSGDSFKAGAGGKGKHEAWGWALSSSAASDKVRNHQDTNG